MGLLAEQGRLAIGAWSPGGSGGGYIAAATYAGAVESDSTAALELLSVDIQRSKLIPTVELRTPQKFCALHWGSPSRSNPAGLIAGGFVDGTVRVWDAATLIRSPQVDAERSLVYPASSAEPNKHSGAVGSVEFNPFLQTRLATGAADGLVLVWDLSNPSSGVHCRHPGAKSAATPATPKEEVSAIAWNRKVQNILGSATSSGVLNVWDLNQSKQVISIRNPRGRLRCSSIAWHPEIATQILITCDADESTGALLWDLRNAKAPISSFTEHNQRGIVASSWNYHDPDLLLLSSQDSRTVVVSVSTGEVIAESPPSASYNFDVKWSSRVPGLYLSSSYDGRFSVDSILTASSSPSDSSETATAVMESFGVSADVFQAGVADQSPRISDSHRVQYNPRIAPKWLKRPTGVCLGFGGVQASFSKAGSFVTVGSFTEAIPGLTDTCTKLDATLLDLTSEDPSPAVKWCKDSSAAASSKTDKMGWDALAIMFQTDCRRKMLEYLGFLAPPMDACDEIAMPVFGLCQSQPLTVPVRPVGPSSLSVSENKPSEPTSVDVVANGAAARNLDGPAPWDVTEPNDDVNLKQSILDDDESTVEGTDLPSNKISAGDKGISSRPSLVGKTKEQVNSMIKQSIIVGDFKAAVDACLHIGRTADALIIAHAGGPDLWFDTQAEYLSKAGLSSSCSVVGAVAGPQTKMEEYIREAGESKGDTWKDALAMILTFCPQEELPGACTSLGQRLMMNGNDPSALFCFICGSNVQMAISCWARETPITGKSTTEMMATRSKSLVGVVEKIRLMTAAIVLSHGEREIGTVRAIDEVCGSIFCEFGALLVSQGENSLAITYLNNLDPSYSCVYGSAGELSDRAAKSLAASDPDFAPHAPSEGVQPANNVYRQARSASLFPTPDYNSIAPPPPPGPRPSYGGEQPRPASTLNSWGGGGGGVVPAVPPPYPPAPQQQTSATIPAMPPAMPPRPTMPHQHVPQRSTMDPSALYSDAPSYTQAQMPPPPAPAPGVGAAPAGMPPMLASQIPTAAPVTPVMSGVGAYSLPSVPMNGTGMAQPTSMVMGRGIGMSSPAMPAPPPPPPPPPTDNNSPPMPYHARARHGQGSSLPPSAEVAVAETRRSKPPSASGMPGRPPRRSNSSSSSLSALTAETVYLDKVDVSKVPADQQVIVKSLRGSFMYAQSLNQSSMYRRKMDDVSKRLGRLLAGLNAGVLDDSIVELLVSLGNRIESANYDEVNAIVAKLSKQHWDAGSKWIQGLKWLSDAITTGR